jgi:hypothetical protein
MAENGRQWPRMEENDKLNLITRRLIGAAFEVHRHLGPGWLSLPTQQV